MERQTTTVTIEVPEGASMGPFAHLLRAPSEGHAILTVDHAGQSGQVIVDLAVGEPGEERGLLRLDQRGRLDVPEAIPADAVLSVRCQGQQPGLPVTVSLEFETRRGRGRRPRAGG